MRDVCDFQSPLGFFGRIADYLVLTHYLRHFHRRIFGLEAHHPPGTLDQRGAHPRVASLGHAPWDRLLPLLCSPGHNPV